MIIQRHFRERMRVSTYRLLTIPVFVLGFLTGYRTSAQVNTEKMRPGSQATGLTGEVGLAMEIRSGNVEFIDLGLRGRIDYHDSLWLAFVTGTFQLRSQSRDVFDRNGFVHLRYNRVLGSDLVFEIFAQQEYNKSLQLKNRALVGSGFRIPVFRDGDLPLVIGSSWMYEYEERTARSGDPDVPVTRVHRWNNYLVLRYLGIPHVQFANTVYFQPRFDDWNDFRILDEGVLTFEISKVVSITNSIAYRFDNRPPTDVRRADLAFRTGILFSF